MADEGNKARKTNKPAKKKTEAMSYSASAKPQISDIIGRRLRTYYDEVAAQPVPDRFIELLARMEGKSRPKKPE
jgi:Anti-sigma factor NepR